MLRKRFWELALSLKLRFTLGNESKLSDELTRWECEWSTLTLVLDVAPLVILLVDFVRLFWELFWFGEKDDLFEKIYIYLILGWFIQWRVYFIWHLPFHFSDVTIVYLNKVCENFIQ